MTEKEDEQLLEDASTLLMFASAVARQSSPDGPATGSSSDQKGKTAKSQSPPPATVPAGVTEVPISSSVTLLHAPQTGKPHLPSMVSMSVPPSTYLQTAKDPLASAHMEKSSSGLGHKPHLPHLHASQLALASGLPPANYPYYPYGYASGHPPKLGPPLRYAPPSTGMLSSSVPQISSRTAPPTPLALHQHDSLLNRSGNLYIQPAGQNVHLPGQPGLPAKGSFQTHRRTVSAGHHPIGMKSPSSASPGPANVTLSRGINVETGKRNTDNAMIAAAALAAAADIPLPLKNKKDVKPPKAKSQSEPQLKAPASILNTASATVVKTEDSVMTEPEEDENRTEDEPLLESREAVESTETPISKEASSKEAKPSSLATSSVTEPKVFTGPAAGPQSAPDLTTETAVVPWALTGSDEVAPSGKLPAADNSVKPIEELELIKKDASKQPDFIPPPLSEYKVDPDSGIIGCICGIEEDDGFTIQCDVCFRWQHCSCMGYKTNEEVPEDVYKCYYCDKSKWHKFDPEVCRADTMARLDLEKVNEPEIKQAPPKRKSSNSGGDDKKRRKSEKDVKGVERPSGEKRKSSSTTVNTSPQISVNSSIVEINNKDNPLLEDGVCAELYQGVYYKLEDNDYKTAEVKGALSELGRKFEANGAASDIKVISLAAFKSIKFSKIILPNYQKHLQERNELRRGKGFNDTAIQVKAYSENPKQKFIGISKIGLFISKRSDSNEEDIIPPGTAVTEFLGEVDRLELYMSNHANQYSTWGTVKPHVARVDLQLQDGHDPVSIVLDSRFVGNEARFIRKSCPTTANCEIRTFYISQLQAFKHVVYTTKPIALKGENMEEELRLKWEWDKNHPINKMIVHNGEGTPVEGMKFEDFTDEDKVLLVSGVDTILNFVECACNTTSTNLQCAIFKIKKATSYLLRSTRKASSLTNIAFNKSKEELVMPKKIKQFVSWKQRLSERDEMLNMSIFSIGNTEENSEEFLKGDATFTADQDDSVQEVEKFTKGESLEQTKATQKLPYKQQLLVQGRRLASRKYIADTAETFPSTSSNVPKTIAIPLVSEILKSINETINDSLKPLAKISSNVSTGVNVSEQQQVGTEIEAMQPSWKEASPALALQTKEIPVIEPKPQAAPLVKKLSFADYKKKMK